MQPMLDTNRHETPVLRAVQVLMSGAQEPSRIMCVTRVCRERRAPCVHMCLIRVCRC